MPKWKPSSRSAITQEEMSHDFYQRLAGLVSHQETKDILEFLAKDELEHKAFLLGCVTPQGCKLTGAAQNAHLAEMLEAPAINDDMTPKEALVIAMKREEGSYRFYQTLAGSAAPGRNSGLPGKDGQRRAETQRKGGIPLR